MTTASAFAQRFGQAHAALTAGDAAGARAILTDLVALDPRNVGVRQALGVAERRLGSLDAARLHLGAALDLAPNDPNLHNSFANVLGDLGDDEAAIAHYRRAIAISPELLDARVNLGLALRAVGQPRAALETLEAATDLDPRRASAWLALGLTLIDLAEPTAAALALDTALALSPENLPALQARAQLAADAGHDALPLYARARALAPQHPTLILGEATALHRRGDGPAAISLLEAQTARDPGWRAGQAALAQLRWQWEGAEDFLRGYRIALQARPDDAELRGDQIAALARAGRHDQALAAISAAGPSEAYLLLEAATASEAGDLDRADTAFARARQAGFDPGVGLVRHLLRRGEVARAAAACEPLAFGGDRGAWPYLAAAWRAIGDPRWRWLEGDPAFIGVYDLDLGTLDLPDLATTLRKLHVAQRAPYDQTVRGGIQTDGHLFLRAEPQIAALRRALEAQVLAHLANLPPRDPSHPLLAPPRDAIRFSGAWSVRLQGGGFHTAHVHPQGWISSAFYVAVPDLDPAKPDGQLVLGQPPAELGLALEPLAVVAPRPGRLVLFPSYTWHGTALFPAGERMSVAFDVVESR